MNIIHIVDDEESVRMSLAFLLDIAGFATRTYKRLHEPDFGSILDLV